MNDNEYICGCCNGQGCRFCNDTGVEVVDNRDYDHERDTEMDQLDQES